VPVTSPRVCDFVYWSVWCCVTVRVVHSVFGRCIDRETGCKIAVQAERLVTVTRLCIMVTIGNYCADYQ
jgi:hypothetical protein